MLEIHLLGQFDLRRDGIRLELSSRPGQSLLAYLALNAGIAHRREFLAGLFWPDATEANARGYLRKALWQVRKALGRDPSSGNEYRSADEISIGFDPTTEFWLDAAVVRRKPSQHQPVEDLLEAFSAIKATSCRVSTRSG